MSKTRATTALFWASLFAALVLMLMPLPELVRPLRPFWLALALIYWGLEEPGRVPLGRAFVLGLACDVLTGNLLGEMALRLTVLDFIVLRFRARMRFFPMLQQSLAVLALLVNDRVLMLMVRSFSEPVFPDYALALAPLTGTALWPWLFLLFDELRQKARPREA